MKKIKDSTELLLNKILLSLNQWLNVKISTILIIISLAIVLFVGSSTTAMADADLKRFEKEQVKVIYGLKYYKLFILQNSTDGIIWDVNKPVLIVDKKDRIKIVKRAESLGLDKKKDFDFISLEEVVKEKGLLTLPKEKKAAGEDAPLRINGYKGIGGKPAIIELSSMGGMLKLFALKQTALYRIVKI